MDRQQSYTVEDVDLKWLEQTVRRAGEIALSHFRQVKAERKADSTIVTAADKEIEAFLRDELSQAFPDDGLLGEEMPMHRGSNGRVWAIDPIDGTASYASGLPVWGVSVGLMRDWQPIAGVFYMPLTDEFFAGDGHWATLNGDPIRVNDTAHVDGQSFLCVTAETHRAYEIYFEGKTRSLGSAAAHICYVARGTAVAALLGHLALWDMAGALPVLQGAGGNITHLDDSLDDFSLEFVADGRQYPNSLLAGPAWALPYFKERIRERFD